MKTATLPSLRVEPELREELEAMLAEGETVSAFIEASVRKAMRRRQLDTEFHARAVASYERVMAGEEPTFTTAEVMDGLRQKLEEAKRTLAARQASKKTQ
jgi:hypothetical protein